MPISPATAKVRGARGSSSSASASPEPPPPQASVAAASRAGTRAGPPPRARHRAARSQSRWATRPRRGRCGRHGSTSNPSPTQDRPACDPGHPEARTHVGCGWISSSLPEGSGGVMGQSAMSCGGDCRWAGRRVHGPDRPGRGPALRLPRGRLLPRHLRLRGPDPRGGRRDRTQRLREDHAAPPHRGNRAGCEG